MIRRERRDGGEGEERGLRKWGSKTKIPPHVEAVYAIENSDLQKKCDNFKETLSHQGHPHESDEYFHGTTVACDIIKTQVLYRKHDCAICSMSCSGMNFKCMGKTNPKNPFWQRSLFSSSFIKK